MKGYSSYKEEVAKENDRQVINKATVPGDTPPETVIIYEQSTIETKMKKLVRTIIELIIVVILLVVIIVASIFLAKKTSDSGAATPSTEIKQEYLLKGKM